MRSMGMTVAGFIAFVILAAAFGQTIPTTTFDPLSGYVGTWIATNPFETTPFLILRLSAANGALTGTMSRFTVKSARNGEITWRALPYAAAEISDLKTSDSSLWFHWVGEPPLLGGEVKFVAEGTDVAYINIPISQEEANRIVANYRGLYSLSPTIELRREGAAASEHSPRRSKDWKEQLTAALINQAEFQYRFDHGIYGDYLTLMRSGQLGRTMAFNFTIVPIDLNSETEPFPEHVIRLVVSPDGAAYQLSIEWKLSGSCIASFLSDQTGVVTESHTGDCNPWN